MSVIKGVSSVVHVINFFIGVSDFVVIAPTTCFVARIFMMFLCVLVSSAHAHVVNLCMQTSCVASDVI